MIVAAGIDVGTGLGVGAGLEAGAGFDAEAESAAEGRAGAGLGTGRSQTTAFAPGQGSGAGWLGAANGSAARSSDLSGESFRSNWQAMLRAWGVVPRASGGATSTEANGAGEIGTANEADEREGARSVPAFLAGAHTEVTGQIMPAAGQGNGPVAGVTEPSSAQTQSNLSLGNAAAALRLQMLADAANTGVRAQTIEASAAANTTSSTSTTRSATATAGSAKSGRWESVPEGTKAERRAGSASDALLATPINGSAVAAAAPTLVQAQALPTGLPASPTSGLADRWFSSASGAESDTGAAEGAAISVSSGTKTAAMGAAGTTAVQPRANAWAASHNPVGAAQSVPQDEETSGVIASPLSEPRESTAEQQNPIPSSMEALIKEWPAPNASPGGTESGSRVAQGIKTPAAETGGHLGTEERLGAEGNSTASAQSPSASSSVDKPAVESGGQSSQQALGRPAHGVAAGETSSATAHVAVTQPFGAAVDDSAWVRDPSGAYGTASAAAAVAASAAGGPVTAASETFAALDAGTAVGTPGWIHAGSQRAEAGFEDPALGWVGVRADLNAGSVHAAVVPGSPEAAQALSGHLAGLSAYLVEQHTPVATLTMAAPGAGGLNTNGMDAGVDQNMQQSAGQNAEQNTAATPQADAPSSAVANASGPVNITAESGGFDAMAYAGEGRGMHISVMA